MTINQAFYTHLVNDSTIISTFNKLFYIENDGTVEHPYATVYMIDDPEERNFFCDKDQGQARFACDCFTEKYDIGIDKRAIYKSVVRALQAQTVSGIKIHNVEIVGTVDRGKTINNLLQFSFEVILTWELL